MYSIDRFNNNFNKLRKAIQFRQFSWKLLQIRFFSELAKHVSLGQFYKSPVLPKEITIRVTEKCFLKCKFCAQGGERGRVDRKNLKTGPVEKDTLKKIIEETSRWPIKPFIKITGGEPLMLGDSLLDVIGEMRERKFVVKLNTNGMLLKNKKIARRIAETDLNYLSISIDGGRDVHNEIRGNPKLFDAIMEGIDNVREYSRELKKKNVMILVSMIVTSETQDQIEELYRIVLDKGIDWLNIQLLNYTTPETCAEASRYFHDRFQIEEEPWTAFCNPRFTDIKPDLIESQIKNIAAQRKSIPISVM